MFEDRVQRLLVGPRALILSGAALRDRPVDEKAVAEEIARHMPDLAIKGGLDQVLLFAALRVMPIDWRPVVDCEARREEAEKHIAARDPDDWPTVALALELPVWSQDKDLASTGLDVFTTGDLLDTMRDAS